MLPIFAVFALSFGYVYSQQNEPLEFKMAQANTTVELSFPISPNFRRNVQNDGKTEEHLFRVCNGKNKKTCGYWENVKTKKRVPGGPTTFNKTKKALIIKKIRPSDGGTYMTGNRKKQLAILVM